MKSTPVILTSCTILWASLCFAQTPKNAITNVLDHGISADGKTLNTVAINRLIATTADAGGGTVFFPAGTYLTGTIYLKSGVTLELGNGATVLGCPDLDGYPENPGPRPGHDLEWGRYSLIFADGQHDIAVVGNGRIYGQGGYFVKKELEAKGWSTRDAYLKRPYGLCFVRCQRVQVKGVFLYDLGFWTQDYLDCDDVLVEGVTVDSCRVDANNDGIDIDGSRNVRVSDCHFHDGDDAICLKSSYSVCENVTITNCVASSLANGIKFGTASYRGFKNIVVSNCVIYNTNCAGLALEVVDGGSMDGVAISNITMTNVGAAIFLRLGDRGRAWVSDAPKQGIGTLRNIAISNIVAHIWRKPGDSRPLGDSITGQPDQPIENVSISDVFVIAPGTDHPDAVKVNVQDVPEIREEYPEFSSFGSMPAYGLFVRHVRGLTLRNVSFRYEHSDPRSALVCDDVEDLKLDGVQAYSQTGARPTLVFNNVRDGLIQGTVARAGTPAFLELDGRCANIVLMGNDLSRAECVVASDATAQRSPVLMDNNRLPPGMH